MSFGGPPYMSRGGRPRHGFRPGPRFNPGRPWGQYPPVLPPPGPIPPMALQPEAVLAWMDVQHPIVLRRVIYHARWLLEQQGLGEDDSDDEGNEEEGDEDDSNTAGWYEEETVNTTPGSEASGSGEGAESAPPHPHMAKRPKHPGFGWPKAYPYQQQQWTPAGWMAKDNSHKVTSTMRPLPEPEIVPPQSSTYPEAAADREKLQMLKNNVGMMQFELNKICRRLKISVGSLDKDDLTAYPEDQQQRLKTAINCVSAAEKTLNEFIEFLKEEKYKEWNETQKKAHEEKVREMIGDMPTGVPHKRSKPDEEEKDKDAE